MHEQESPENLPDEPAEKPPAPPGREMTEPASQSAYAVLRNAISRYLIGRFVASLGQQMLVVAIDWELYQRTHSALSLAFVGLSLMVPMILCTMPAGHFADTFNRKRNHPGLHARAGGGERWPDAASAYFAAPRGLDLHLPVCPRRGADFFLAGQRGVCDQPGAA